MAFLLDGLSRISSSGNTGSRAQFLYASTDTIAVMRASGYFNDITRILKLDDSITLVDTTNNEISETYRVNSATLAATVTLSSRVVNLNDWELRDGILSGEPACQVGTDTSTSVRMAGGVYYQIDGQVFHAPALEAVLDGAGDDVDDTKFGAWRIELSAAGVLTTIAAVASGDQTFATAEDAIMNLASQARTAGTIDVGYLVLEADTLGFTIGTDDPVTSESTVVAATYTNVAVRQYGSGLSAALGAATTTPDGVATIGIGTVDLNINGDALAQIAAQETAAFDDADTVTVDDWGGWLLISDHAGTGTYLLAADGIAGSVSAMTFTTKALVDIELDTIQDLLPLTMGVLARIYFNNTNDGSVPATWTAGTDDWDDSVIVAANGGSVTDYGIVHDRSERELFSAVKPSVS